MSACPKCGARNATGERRDEEYWDTWECGSVQGSDYRFTQSIDCLKREYRRQGHLEAVEAVRTMSPEHGAYSFDDNSYTLTGYHYVKPETLRRRLARMRSKK